MNEKMRYQDEIEIDLGKLLGVLLKKAWLICLAAVLCAGAVYLGTVCLVPESYRASVLFAVSNVPQPREETGISSGDLAASRELVHSCLVLLDTPETLEAVAETAASDRTEEELKAMISGEAVEDTVFFEAVVTVGDPGEAKELADALARVLPERIGGILEGASVSVAAAPVLPSRPSAPNPGKYAAIAFGTAVVLAMLFFALRELREDTGKP